MVNEKKSEIDQTKSEILKAMIRALNVTANAPHIRDLAAAYALLDGKVAPSAERPFPKGTMAQPPK